MILSVGVRSSIFFYLLAYAVALTWAGEVQGMSTNFSNTPFACALTCSSTTTICGVKKSDSLREDPCALGEAYAGCDRDICQTICVGTDIPHGSYATKSYNQETYSCFNTSSLNQGSEEASRISSYAFNCGVNETHSSHSGSFWLPGLLASDCFDSGQAIWNTSSGVLDDNPTYACTVTCSTTSEGCGPANHDTIGGASACPTGDTWAGCDRDVCQDVCNGTAVAKYTNVDVTKNGKTFTCFNASSLIQTVQEDARQASYAYNCGVNETHAAYGRFMPGSNSASCSSWNTESPHGDNHIIMPPSPPSPPPSPPLSLVHHRMDPYTCALTCSSEGDMCGSTLNVSESISAGPCAYGHSWAGCDATFCKNTCDGHVLDKKEMETVSHDGKQYSCFNSSHLYWGFHSREHAQIASYAFNCGINQTFKYPRGSQPWLVGVYSGAIAGDTTGTTTPACRDTDGNDIWDNTGYMRPPPPPPPAPSLLTVASEGRTNLNTKIGITITLLFLQLLQLS